MADIFFVEPHIESGQFLERFYSEAHLPLSRQLVNSRQDRWEPTAPHSLFGEIMHLVSIGVKSDQRLPACYAGVRAKWGQRPCQVNAAKVIRQTGWGRSRANHCRRGVYFRERCGRTGSPSSITPCCLWGGEQLLRREHAGSDLLLEGVARDSLDCRSVRLQAKRRSAGRHLLCRLE